MKPSSNTPGDFSRRDFLALLSGAGMAFCSGCAVSGNSGNPSRKERIVNAGPASIYAADGIYSKFSGEGFFVVCLKGKLFALSSLCTHKQCRLNAEPDNSFSCPCHGSTFDEKGKVTEGPATRDLPVLATRVDNSGNLLVTVVF